MRGSIRIDGTQCSCPSAITAAPSATAAERVLAARNAFQPPRSAARLASAAFRSQMKPPRSAARFHACGIASTSCHRLHTRCAAPRSPPPTPSSESTWYSRSVLSACSMCVGDDGGGGAEGPEVGGSSSTSIANVGAGRAELEAVERGGRGERSEHNSSAWFVELEASSRAWPSACESRRRQRGVRSAARNCRRRSRHIPGAAR